ncbi:MAG TPA: hypothetical protein H9671_03560 [Firmicutes bacterium]|nr:hypothetical protein [Bacillota bacterium]
MSKTNRIYQIISIGVIVILAAALIFTVIQHRSLQEAQMVSQEYITSLETVSQENQERLSELQELEESLQQAEKQTEDLQAELDALLAQMGEDNTGDDAGMALRAECYPAVFQMLFLQYGMMDTPVEEIFTEQYIQDVFTDGDGKDFDRTEYAPFLLMQISDPFYDSSTQSFLVNVLLSDRSGDTALGQEITLVRDKTGKMWIDAVRYQ